jgi:SAM-dependent methyltransferase
MPIIETMSEKHFIEQKNHARSYLIPYLEQHLPGFPCLSVLEVGCAEAGFLDALRDRGIRAQGLELEPGRIALAKTRNPNLEILAGDITDPGVVGKLGTTFDLIVMRDVIEHVPDKAAAFRNLRALLKSEGLLYITFPPRFSPFGGHHQNGKTLLRKIPYLHLFPRAVIRILGRFTGESPHIIESAIRNYRIGLSISRFEALCRTSGFRPKVKELFLFRPVYRTRMGIKPRRLPDLPLIREFLTLGCECLLKRTG